MSTPWDKPISLDSTSHITLTVSTTFHPAFEQQTKGPADVCFISTDSVHFYIHCRMLKAASTNDFHGLLHMSKPSSPLRQIHIPEHSEVLNVMLHTVYNISPAAFTPTFHTLSSALTQMHQTYGIDLQTWITPSRPLFDTMLSVATQAPLELYALAASLGLEELAKATSSHLLSYPLSNLPDDVGNQMGPIYLRKLFFLHLGRVEALKRIVLQPPEPHPPLKSCPPESQQRLTEGWAISLADLVWEARPGSSHGATYLCVGEAAYHACLPTDVSTASIEFALKGLGAQVTCPQCETALRDRVNHVVKEWALVKVGFSSRFPRFPVP